MESTSPSKGLSDQSELAVALATVPSSFASVTVVGGLTTPTSFDIAPDGRFFICEKAGNLRVVKNGTLLTAPFLTVPVNSDGERGLLGVAFDPNFPTTPYVYIYSTFNGPPLHNRVTRYTVSSSNPDVADPASQTVIFDLDNLSSATNHNGGAIHFGTDGKLYIAVGENANSSNSQSLSNVLGKMLRINKDGTIPSDNPFFGSATGKNRAIWAMGLRNPFTFAFQPGTGRMFINDVGENAWEEVNDGIRGANYGWPQTEGATNASGIKGPLFTYDHSNNYCAITAGAFYNPATMQFPSDYAGDYFFGDYCGNTIKRLHVANSQVTIFATGVNGPIDLKVADDGSLYYLAINEGALGRITYSGNQAPSISQQPANVTTTQGGTATFTVSANGGAPLAYQWLRNGAAIGGATGTSYTLSPTQISDSGAKFSCTVNNSAGSVTSNEAVLTVSSNHAPVPVIDAPVTGTTYNAGQTISYSGSGTDQEDGAIPDANFTWTIVFHHDTHTHPFLGPITGSHAGTFTIPTSGETSSNVWYRIWLKVVDSQGMRDSVFRDVLPNKVNITLASGPTGLQLTLDGQPVTTPYTFTGVVGIQRSIDAITPQSLGGKTYQFTSWSDGGTKSHSISTPAAATTYTATFTETAPPPPTGNIYEAENAAFAGVVVASNYPGYSGTGFVHFVNSSGDYVQWTVNVAAAGQYRLEFRNSNGNTMARNLGIRVNGVSINGALSFQPTGGWGNWVFVEQVATLNAGANTVRAADWGQSGPNFDYLEVRSF